jgi:hypothetical protein
MNAGRLLPLTLIALLIAGCASPQNHKEAKSPSERVALVIMPVIVVSPNREADGDSSSSRDDDSHPRTLFLRNLQYRSLGTGAEFKQVPETTDPGR